MCQVKGTLTIFTVAQFSGGVQLVGVAAFAREKGVTMRDRAQIELTFLGGERMTCEPVAIGQFSFGVMTPEGEEAGALFKHALRSIRRPGQTKEGTRL